MQHASILQHAILYHPRGHHHCQGFPRSVTNMQGHAQVPLYSCWNFSITSCNTLVRCHRFLLRTCLHAVSERLCCCEAKPLLPSMTHLSLCYIPGYGGWSFLPISFTIQILESDAHHSAANCFVHPIAFERECFQQISNTVKFGTNLQLPKYIAQVLGLT